MAMPRSPVSRTGLGHVLADIDGVAHSFYLPDLLLGRKRVQRASSFSGGFDVGPIANVELEPAQEVDDRLGGDRDSDRERVRWITLVAVRSTGVL